MSHPPANNAESAGGDDAAVANGAPDAPGSTSAVRLIDIARDVNRRGARIGVITVGVLVSLPIVCLAISTVMWFGMWGGIAVFADFIGGAILREHALRRASIARIRRACEVEKDICSILDATVCKVDSERAVMEWQELLKHLHELGHCGLAARVRPTKSSAATIEPIAVQFEPLPLNEADDQFRLLADGPQPGVQEPGDLNAGDRRAARNFKRFLRSGGWFTVLFFLLLLVRTAIEAVRMRRVTSPLLLYAVTLVIVVGLPLLGAGWHGSSHLLVPGGLVLRRGGIFAQRFHLHLFKARESILGVVPHGQQWAIFIRDSERSSFWLATEAEVNLLLRTWLSPLSPPSDFLLTEIAGAPPQ